MLVKTRGVTIVGGIFRIFKTLDLRMGDQNDHHSALVTQFLKQADDLSPVSQRMGISPAVAAVGFFDGTDTEFAADLVEDEALEPVNGIHNDGLELVSFVPERGQFCDHLGKRMCKREFPAVDFAESVFSLDEDRSRRGCSKRAVVCDNEIVRYIEGIQRINDDTLTLFFADVNGNSEKSHSEIFRHE